MIGESKSYLLCNLKIAIACLHACLSPYVIHTCTHACHHMLYTPVRMLASSV